MEPTTGVLTQILRVFIDTLDLGIGNLRPTAMNLFVLIGTIELALAGMFWALSGAPAAVAFLKKIFLFSVVYWGVTTYQETIGWITEGFQHAGIVAAGGFQIDAMENPSLIIDIGWASVYPLFQLAQKMSDDWEFFDAIFTTLSGIIVIISYYVLALQVLLVRIEFALVATVGFILLPFAAFSKTAFLAERAIGAIIQFGVRLMALSLVIGLAYPILAQIKLPEDPGWDPILFLMGTSIVVAAIAWHAPGVVAGLFAGAPSLTTNTLGSAPQAVQSGGGRALATGAAVAAGMVAAPGAFAAATQSTRNAVDGFKSAFTRGGDGSPSSSGAETPPAAPVVVTDDMRSRLASSNDGK